MRSIGILLQRTQNASPKPQNPEFFHMEPWQVKCHHHSTVYGRPKYESQWCKQCCPFAFMNKERKKENVPQYRSCWEEYFPDQPTPIGLSRPKFCVPPLTLIEEEGGLNLLQNLNPHFTRAVQGEEPNFQSRLSTLETLSKFGLEPGVGWSQSCQILPWPAYVTLRSHHQLGMKGRSLLSPLIANICIVKYCK